jgi:cytochrome d ubiquinol oxidase subunit II
VGAAGRAADRLRLTDGFDMGVGALLPFVAKTDVERRVVINTVGPVWEGNQVWFILGGGAIFAAWPPLYAVSFSGFYLAMFVVLAALILRPVAFKYRSKRDSARWRNGWDWALFVGGAVPALIFGVAVGNVLQGVPFHLTGPDADLSGQRSHPSSSACLTLRAAGRRGVAGDAADAWRGLAEPEGRRPGRGPRARLIGGRHGRAVGYALAGCGWPSGSTASPGRRGTYRRPVQPALFRGDPRRQLAGPMPHGPGSRSRRAWASSAWRWRCAAARGARGLDAAVVEARHHRDHLLGRADHVPVHPALLVDPNSSLTVWDASSSHQTLFVMLVVTAIFMPLILAYTAWVYKVLWGKVTEDDVTNNSEASTDKIATNATHRHHRRGRGRHSAGQPPGGPADGGADHADRPAPRAPVPARPDAGGGRAEARELRGVEDHRLAAIGVILIAEAVAAVDPEAKTVVHRRWPDARL